MYTNFNIQLIEGVFRVSYRDLALALLIDLKSFKRAIKEESLFIEFMTGQPIVYGETGLDIYLTLEQAIVAVRGTRNRQKSVEVLTDLKLSFMLLDTSV